MAYPVMKGCKHWSGTRELAISRTRAIAWSNYTVLAVMRRKQWSGWSTARHAVNLSQCCSKRSKTESAAFDLLILSGASLQGFGVGW
jgi:hypothetical protein